ncbi:hypothetical protein [Sphingomonas sp. Leaf10]|uniref:hypothetical protein n=1 Tax=Sphingomonas sp. Leaf10 TaxID=1735676 RepID=UPI0012E24D6E|nr:hypothetical protein [Sphingomonas sp. Leaf10]
MIAMRGNMGTAERDGNIGGDGFGFTRTRKGKVGSRRERNARCACLKYSTFDCGPNKQKAANPGVGGFLNGGRGKD